LFGVTVSALADQDLKCQKLVLKLATQLFVERWKVFRTCKRDNFATILDDTTLVSTCLGPPQTDPKEKILKKQTKLTEKIQKSCIDKGVTPVGGVFPGACTAAADGAFAACVDKVTACRFCRAINRADAIVPATNCDLFDDNTVNASCTP
jgi:hypothetical protein